MNFENPNDLVTCPYNKDHKMLRKKLQMHIIRCREIYEDEINLLECPFNKGHLISERDYHQHTMVCSDRKIVAQFIQNSAAVNLEAAHSQIATEENWDDSDNYNNQIS